MKKTIILFAIILALFLSGCEEETEKISFRDHALSLKSDEYVMREDGTVWRIPKRGETLEYFEEYDGSFPTDVAKENSEEMELWEFALAAHADKRVGISKDGSVWIFMYAGSGDRSDGYAYEMEPLGEIVSHDGFWIELGEIGVNPFYEEIGEPHPTVSWVLHDDSGELYDPLLVDLEVLVDGEWYCAAGGYARDTIGIDSFAENGEFSGMTALVTGSEAGYENTQTVPSGHYRLRAKASLRKEYSDEAHEMFSKDQYIRHAVVEFDLIYKDGKYEIENIKN